MAHFPESTISTRNNSTKHDRTIIFLHGRGGNGADFAAELSDEVSSAGMNLEQHFEASSYNVKWIFPTAPLRMSTFWKEEQNEWFDIWSLSDTAARQELQVQGLQESIQHIRGIIDDEINTHGMAPSNIFLGGLSQGFATAFHVLLSQPYRLGGFFGLSGWCPFKQDLELMSGERISGLRQFYAQHLDIAATTTDRTLETPVFMAHCEDDGVVEFRHGEEARDVARKLGLETQWSKYEEGDHWINEPQGVDDIIEFVEAAMESRKSRI